MSALFVTATALLVSGLGARAAGLSALATTLWQAGAGLGLLASLAWTAAAIRERRPSVDVIAVLALGGALIVDEAFAGAMITVMLASGQLLEEKATRRARQELSLLLERAPRTARRYQDGGLAEIDIGSVAPGDRLLVATGEVVPVDGRLSGRALLDESTLTGEPLPRERVSGEEVRSGVVNAGSPFDLVAISTAATSTYAGLVRLVQQAQATSAPLVRRADRLAVLFVPLTLLLAGGAWAASGDPVRAVAVLVVATPCPLLLAAPIALISGLSRCSRLGVVVKGGAVLERLGAAEVVLFDKTGTLTQGKPTVTEVVTDGVIESDELVRLAASLDQVSPHVLANAVVSAATRRGLPLEFPLEVVEEHGYGVRGRVGNRAVKVGKAAWVVTGPYPRWVRQVRRRADLDGSLTVFVAVDDEPVGAFLLEDPVRPDAPRMISGLREAGIQRVVLVTGDRADTADMVGRVVGVDTVLCECDPQDKLAAVAEESRDRVAVMVGDGVNDAPALATASVGVALAARGATASSEAADVVLTVDRVDALADAMLVAHRSRRIALQAVGTGMVLSLAAMVAAAAGLLPPAAGAVLQEAIDVLAIALALRAVLPGSTHTVALPDETVRAAQQLRTEHDAVLAVVEQIRRVADELDGTPGELAAVRTLHRRLLTELVPHERADEAVLVPLVAHALGGVSATAALSRTHAEIEHQVGRIGRLLEHLDGEELSPSSRFDEGAEDLVELRRLLYGLYAILRLHNAQEEEGAFSLLPAPRVPPGA